MGRARLAWGVWIGAALAATLLMSYKLHSGDRGMFLPGTTTSGHYQIELSCDSCHTPYQTVSSEACMNCHKQDLALAEDSHPKAKFTDPRNADRIARLDATSCVACHVEHRPEMTRPMGVTLPDDYCFYCHSDVAKERPSHEGMGFATCASAGCHNFHDNRALYADFLVKHKAEPDLLEVPAVLRRAVGDMTDTMPAGTPDHPSNLKVSAQDLAAWSAASHADNGVNCTGCHTAGEAGNAKWTDHPDYAVCKSCHADEASGFLEGKHGMRLAASLSPMSPALARLPMAPDAKARTLGCGSCHSAHEFDTRRAAADACLECHADSHSLAYRASSHFTLWKAEIDGSGSAGSGVSCATCHLPRLTGGEGDTAQVKVQHNQNANLRPNEKMIREVCMSCHGLGFSIDALADADLVQRNFNGRPSRHIESIDMAVRKAAQK